jgi:hypothetical protein
MISSLLIMAAAAPQHSILLQLTDKPGAKLVYNSNMSISMRMDMGELDEELGGLGEEAEGLGEALSMFSGKNSLDMSHTVVVQHLRREEGSLVSRISSYFEGIDTQGIFGMGGADMEAEAKQEGAARVKRSTTGEYTEGGFPLAFGEEFGLPIFPTYSVRPGAEWKATAQFGTEELELTHKLFAYEKLNGKWAARIEVSGLKIDAMEVEIKAPAVFWVDPHNGRTLKMVLTAGTQQGPASISLSLVHTLVRADEAAK